MQKIYSLSLARHFVPPPPFFSLSERSPMRKQNPFQNLANNNEKITFEVDKKLIAVDYLGTVALTKALLPYFIQQKKGHFVTVTSLMGKFGSPYRSGYCGAKHALHGFFDVLRMEHEKDNIKVTLICPGFVQTNVAINALTANGETQKSNDEATQNGMPVDVFASKMIKAIEANKFEAYIGGKEVLGVYLKRFFPKMLHYFVLESKVR